MIDLGTLGGRNSEARAIADFLSTVVGTSEVAGGGSHAFVYSAGVMTDLNALLPAGSGWILEDATSVNASGEIVGYGLHNGSRHAFRLTPQATILLLAGGLRSNLDSNLPHSGVEAGRTVLFVTSAEAIENTARNVVMTSTFTGPVDIVSCGPLTTWHLSVSGTNGHLQPTVDRLIRAGRRRDACGRPRHRPRRLLAHYERNRRKRPPGTTNTVREENIGLALAGFTLGRDHRRRRQGGLGDGDFDQPAESRRVGRQDHQQQSGRRANAGHAGRPERNQPPHFQHRPAGRLTADDGDDLRDVWPGDHFRSLTVVPPALSTLSLSRSTIIGSCQTASGKVALDGFGARLRRDGLAGHDHRWRQDTADVVVPAGATSATFTVTTNAVSSLNKGTFTPRMPAGRRRSRSACGRFISPRSHSTPSVGGGTVAARRRSSVRRRRGARGSRS